MRLGSRLTIALAAFALLAAGPANAAPKIPSSLLCRLSQNPSGPRPRDRARRARHLLGFRRPRSSSTSSSKPLKLKRFAVVPAVAVQLSPALSVMRLSPQPGLLSITEDAPMVSARYSNPQRWPSVSGLAKLWSDVEKARAQPPAIAVVDTGIDATRTDFGGTRHLPGDAHLSSRQLRRRRPRPRHVRRLSSPRLRTGSTRAPLPARRSSRSTSPTTRACL